MGILLKLSVTEKKRSRTIRLPAEDWKVLHYLPEAIKGRREQIIQVPGFGVGRKDRGKNEEMGERAGAASECKDW